MVEAPYYSDIIDHWNDEDATKITDHIYIGNKLCSNNLEYLLKLGITNVIRVGNELKDNFIEHFVYLSINIKDSSSENIYPYFNVVYDFIEKAIESKGMVYIHCYAGISRSVSLLASYLMKKNSLNFYEAIDIIKSKRKIAYPNTGFTMQLNEWYLKEVKQITKTQKGKDYSNITTSNYKKPFKKKHAYYIIKKPGRKKNHSLKIKQIKTTTQIMELELKKIKLYSFIENELLSMKSLNFEEKQSKLKVILSSPMTIVNSLFKRKKTVSVEIEKNRKNKLCSFVKRYSNKFINELLK